MDAISGLHHDLGAALLGRSQGAPRETPGEAPARRTVAVPATPGGAPRGELLAGADSVTRVFAARLFSAIDAPPIPAFDTRSAYDGPQSLVPQFLRAIGGVLADVASPAGAGAVLEQARSIVQDSAAEVQPLARQGGEQSTQAVAQIQSGLERGLDMMEKRLEADDEGSLRVSQGHIVQDLKGRFGLDIETRDGDVVQLRFKLERHAESYRLERSNGETGSSSTQTYVSTDAKLQVEVEGSLDDDELAAIRSVIEAADAFASELLSGNPQAALATGFAFDSNELAAVAMRMQVSEHTRLSVSHHTSMPVPERRIAGAGDDLRPGAAVATAAPPARPTPGVAEAALPAVEPVAVTPPASEAAEPAAQAGPGEVAPAVDPQTRLAQSLSAFLLRTRTSLSAAQGPDGAQVGLRIEQKSLIELLQTLIRVRSEQGATQAPDSD